MNKRQAAKIAQAQSILQDLGFANTQTNTRSALTLIALLKISPSKPWSSASNDLFRVVDIMQWMRDRYGADYAPNSRELARIPVTLLDGSPVYLTPGGQNVLLKAILEEFCPRWTPDGKVLYVGDAGKDDPVLDVVGLSALRIDLDKHGKLPDLIVYMPDRNWLVLLEAASSHGPVDAKRHAELKTLLGSSSAGLVYVTCFSSRAEMRKYLTDIAWETDAWCAEDPTHLIHFNGERFLGPYDPSDDTPRSDGEALLIRDTPEHTYRPPAGL
ncbi:MAG: BsuBI/PstI family type II restriction endonuclease [Solirubrobacteraceae bacterium]